MRANELHAIAHAAGHKAATECNPVPMYVYGQGTNEVVLDGSCGFASIHFKGNTAFGREMKKLNLAVKSYMGGLMVWVGDYRQSMSRKTAYARAYAAVLREHGVDASAQSRID